MSSFPVAPNSLRKVIHDLNGELFLIRGYAELTAPMVAGVPLAARNLQRILERTDELEAIVKRLRQRQLELEGTMAPFPPTVSTLVESDPASDASH